MIITLFKICVLFVSKIGQFISRFAIAIETKQDWKEMQTKLCGSGSAYNTYTHYHSFSGLRSQNGKNVIII